SCALTMHWAAQGEMPGAMRPPTVGTGDVVGPPGATSPPSLVPLTGTATSLTLMVKLYGPVGREAVWTVKSSRKIAPLGRLPCVSSSFTQATVVALQSAVSAPQFWMSMAPLFPLMIFIGLGVTTKPSPVTPGQGS